MLELASSFLKATNVHEKMAARRPVAMPVVQERELEVEDTIEDREKREKSY